MATKIKIAELDINTDALIKATADVKKEIDSLKKAQKDLTKNGETSSKQFVKNSADLKALSSAYNKNLKALSENTQATADQAHRTEILALTLEQEATSIKEAREQNKLLNKLRNEANVTTEEGRNELLKLNQKLDENNKFIKENADAYLKQKINIGNYTDSMIEALETNQKNIKTLKDNNKELEALRDSTKEGGDEWNFYQSEINNTNTQINILIGSVEELNDEAESTASISKLLSGGFKGLAEDAKSAGGASKLLGSSLKVAAKGMFGMVKASLAFIATPIGAVLAAIVLAFALVKNAMSRSEEATNKITKIFTTFSGIVSKLLKFLEPLGSFLIDGIVVGFELAGQAAEKALDIISSGLSLLGFDDAAKSVTEFKEEMSEAAGAAAKLADAEAQLQKSQRESRRIQLEFQKDAEKLRQIRDDETKSFAERQKANEELGAVLKKQQEEELKIAQQSLLVANLRIDAEGQTTDLLNARADALAEISDIQERITGQESEQLTNRVALQKEANDKAIEQQKGLLDLFIAQQGIKAKSLEEEVTIAQEVSNRKQKILAAELANRKITQAQFDAGVIEAQNELLTVQTNLTISNAERELSAHEGLNTSKIESDKFFTEQSLAIEQERLDGIAEKQREFQAIRLDEGVINEQEFNDAINLINEENRIANAEAELLRKEAKEEQQLIDLENKAILDEENFNNAFELETARELRRFEAEKKAAIKTGASLELINRKHVANQKKIDQGLQDSKIAATGATLQIVTGILGEESAAGKAAALAQALINTYQGISAGVALGYPAAIPAVIAAAAAGFGAVKKITSTSTKFEAGGLQEIGGSRHSAGGTKFMGEDGTSFEAESGELIGVMNRNAARHFMDFNNSYPSGNSTPTFFQGGGIISRGVTSQTVDTNELARITQQAVASLPPPIVTVEDINAGQIDTADVVSGADI